MRIDTGAPEAVSKIEQKLVSAVERHRMIPEGAYVVAGVSGGADSMALLHFLSRIEGIRLLAAHVNHGLRGAEADRDEGFVRDWCAAHGIALEILHADVARLAREQKQGIEECGRAVRYHFFEKLAGTDGRIATAHTLSDSVETVIYHLATGTAAAGLCGIPPVRGNIIRPLIGITRREVEEYCEYYSIPFQTDSTNFSREYARNRIRLDIVPVLRELNPAAEQAIGRMTEAVSQDNAYLDGLALESLEQASRWNGYAVDRLRELADPVLARAVREIIGRTGRVRLSAEQLLGAVRLVREGQGALSVAGGVNLRVENGYFFAVPSRKNEWIFPFIPPQTLTGDGRTVIIRMLPREDRGKIHNLLSQNVIDYAIISDTAVIRTRRPGDSFRPAGRGVTKSLKKLFNEMGIPPSARDSLVILEQEGEILWIEGIGPSERAAAGPESNAAWIEVRKHPS